MFTGWYFVNLVWICRFVEVREFYFLKFSPKCAQELTLAQGSVCFLISAGNFSSPPVSPGSKAAAVPAVPGQGGQGRVAAQFSVCTSIDTSCWCVTAATHGEKWTWGSVLFSSVCLLPFCPLPVTGSGGSVQVRTYDFRSSSHRTQTAKYKIHVLTELGEQWNDVLQTCFTPFFSWP